MARMAREAGPIHHRYVFGFGDLVAATDLGPSLAIAEALSGQIYLVTVVALIVANLSASHEPRESGPLAGGGGRP